MHDETNMCVKREADPSVGYLVQRMVGPAFRRSVTLGQVILGWFCLVLVSRTNLNVSNHRVEYISSRRHSVPLAAQATDFTPWGTDPTGRATPRGVCPSPLGPLWLGHDPPFPFCCVPSELSSP